MRIDHITHQSRRDFTAVYVCETCGATKESSGYDDAYFHQYVIPQMKCPECGMRATDDYRARPTKYAEGEQV